MCDKILSISAGMEEEEEGQEWREPQQSTTWRTGDRTERSLGSKREESSHPGQWRCFSWSGKHLQCCPRVRNNKASRGGACRVDSSSRRSPQRTQTRKQEAKEAWLTCFLGFSQFSTLWAWGEDQKTFFHADFTFLRKIGSKDRPQNLFWLSAARNQESGKLGMRDFCHAPFCVWAFEQKHDFDDFVVGHSNRSCIHC